MAESKGAAQQEERKKQRQQKTFGKEASRSNHAPAASIVVCVALSAAMSSALRLQPRSLPAFITGVLNDADRRFKPRSFRRRSKRRGMLWTVSLSGERTARAAGFKVVAAVMAYAAVVPIKTTVLPTLCSTSFVPTDGTFDVDSDGPKRGAAAGRGGKRDDGRGNGKGARGSDLPQKGFKRQAKDAK